jgi:predicted metal-dependent hydrolase
VSILSYISCLLTIISTVLVGRRYWQGWVVAGVNSMIVTVIGVRTAQWGFVPANLFCVAIYFYNIRSWRLSADGGESPSGALSARLEEKVTRFYRPGLHGVRANDERLTSNRIRQRAVPD